MEYGIIGTSIWQQNLPLLEKLTIDREIKIDKLNELKSALGVDELIYLATCNRVEFVYFSNSNHSDGHFLHRLIDFFFSDGNEINFFPNDFYHYKGKEAITHLFRTVSSLESLVVGETQITGQFKDAYEEALGAGLVGLYLNKLANEAVLVSKKIKRETSIGEGAQSMASLASDELSKYFQSDENPMIALVGAGEMTEKFAKYIMKEKIGRLLFVNRSQDKAEKLAKKYGGESISLEDFISNPEKVDAIMSATAAPDTVFDFNFIKNTQPTNKAVLCIDLAVPRDFSNDFNIDDNFKVIDIQYLKGKAQGNLRRKFVEASKANEIIKESVHNFISDRMEVFIKPIFHNTYKESVELANQALNDLFAKKVTTLSDDDQNAIINLVTKLIGHSSFQPSKVISDRLAQTEKITFEGLQDNQKEAI